MRRAALVVSLSVALAACAGPSTLETVAVANPRLPPPYQGVRTDEISAPRIARIRLPQPGDTYPAFERRKRIGGSPRVRLLISETGVITDAEVIGTVSPGLDSLALALASQSEFWPGRTGGVPAAMTADVTYSFVAP